MISKTTRLTARRRYSSAILEKHSFDTAETHSLGVSKFIIGKVFNYLGVMNFYWEAMSSRIFVLLCCSLVRVSGQKSKF
jgi:hypothetical protein